MNKDALNDVAARKARLQEKPYKLVDERGLYLLVNAIGKYWRFDYRFEGRRKTLALGVYPDTTLAVAREQERYRPSAACQWGRSWFDLQSKKTSSE